MKFLRALMLGVSLLLVSPVLAHSPHGDPELDKFYESLKIPGTELSCCNLEDCKPVKIRTFEGKLQAFIDKSFPGGDEKWYDVPTNKVLTPRENPVGEPVACWNSYIKIICFVNGSGT